VGFDENTPDSISSKERVMPVHSPTYALLVTSIVVQTHVPLGDSSVNLAKQFLRVELLSHNVARWYLPKSV